MSMRPPGANAGASETTTEELAKAMSVLGQETPSLSANSEGEPMSAPTLNAEAPAISRNLVVSIRASLNDLVQESSAAKWQPTEGALNSIFKQRRFTSLDGTTEAQGDLSSVVLHSLKVTHAKNSFPVSVGAKIFGVDHNTYASTGEAFSVIVPGKTDRTMDRTLQKDPVEMAYSFAAKFPGYTAANLRTKGIHEVAAKRFVLITADHPVVSAIHENSDKLQLGDVAAMPEGLIKVSSSLFEALLPMVQQQVSSQIRVRDFNGASVSIAPPEHGTWDAVREHLVNECLEDDQRQLAEAISTAETDDVVAELRADFAEKQAKVERAVDNEKHELNIELQVDYNFLSNEPQSPGGAASALS